MSTLEYVQEAYNIPVSLAMYVNNSKSILGLDYSSVTLAMYVNKKYAG